MHIIADAPFFMYALDAEMRLTQANKIWFEAYKRLLGNAPKIGDLLPHTTQDTLKKYLSEAYQKALQGEIIETEDFIENEAKTEKIWYKLHLSPIKEADKITGVLAVAWDISEKNQWKAKYEDLINKITEAIFLIDIQNGKIVFANDKAQKLIGRNMAEIVEMHHSELHPERFRAEYTKAMQDYIETDKTSHQIFWVIHKDGHEIPTAIIGNLLEHDGKQMIQGIFRDMTTYLEAQQALEKQKEFYETILNHIPIDIAVLDKNDTYTYLNPKAIKDEELRKWLIGKKILDYYEYRNLDTKRGEVKQNQLHHIRQTKIPTKWEDNIKDKQGKEVHLLRRFTPILDEKEQFVMSLFTGENITYLKQAQQQLLSSEQRYRNLVETTSDWIWETNIQGKFTYCSPQVYDILGYTPKEVVGKSVMQFTTQGGKDKKWQIFQEIWARGDNFMLEELEYQHKSGKIVLLQTSGAPIYNSDWELTNYRGIARDVTRQKGAEHLLQNTLRELKDRNFELDSFVYKVSHDLRAPLSSMLGLLNLMQLETTFENMPSYIQMMQDRAQKLDNFIRTVLAYSQNLNQHIAPQRIDFQKLIAQCFDELQYMPCAPRMTWILKQKDDTPFYNDEFRLMIIFKNFISNAIKYQKTNQDESTLQIKIEVNHAHATISIQDEGIGIESEYLPKIFDMFYRATEKAEGSGLGLYIVKQALDKIKGKVRIESIYNQGTTIFLKIPNVPA